MGEFSISTEALACSGACRGPIGGIGREIEADEWQAVPDRIFNPRIPNILTTLKIPKMPNAPAETRIDMQLHKKPQFSIRH